MISGVWCGAVTGRQPKQCTDITQVSLLLWSVLCGVVQWQAGNQSNALTSHKSVCCYDQWCAVWCSDRQATKAMHWHHTVHQTQQLTNGHIKVTQDWHQSRMITYWLNSLGSWDKMQQVKFCIFSLTTNSHAALHYVWVLFLFITMSPALWW